MHAFINFVTNPSKEVKVQLQCMVFLLVCIEKFKSTLPLCFGGVYERKIGETLYFFYQLKNILCFRWF